MPMPWKIIEPGDRCGRWTILERATYGEQRVLCRCECGTERPVRAQSLQPGRPRSATSCGCQKADANRKRLAIDMAGASLGDLTVVGPSRRKRKHGLWWECRCSCGARFEASGAWLRKGATHCGCKRPPPRKLPTPRSEMAASKTPEYAAWSRMLGRCYCETDSRYSLYGGRGIRVCDRWRGRAGFAAFLADMGPRPGAGLSLDRIDVNGNYEPGNCRWATQAVQTQNRRMSVLTMEKAREIRRLRGTGMTEHAIAREIGVTRASVHLVIKNKTWKDGDSASA